MNADRLLRLICLLDAKPRTTAELASLLRVDEMTVRRAVKRLAESGIKIRWERAGNRDSGVRSLESDPACPTCRQPLSTTTVRRVLR